MNKDMRVIKLASNIAGLDFQNKIMNTLIQKYTQCLTKKS